jgi:RNA polymerase sigma-70 factor (ECF subfamily)
MIKRPTVNPLVTALANGQAQAYAALFDRLGGSLLRVASVMLRSAADAEDVVQDVFVEIVRHRDRMLLIEDLDAYVFAMLRNAVVRRLTRQRAEQQHLKKWVPMTNEKPDALLTDDIELAMQSLPQEQREVISLKMDGGLTFAQIAEILQVSSNTAASRYRYAIGKLRIILE